MIHSSRAETKWRIFRPQSGFGEGDSKGPQKSFGVNTGGGFLDTCNELIAVELINGMMIISCFVS